MCMSKKAMKNKNAKFLCDMKMQTVKIVEYSKSDTSF